MNAKKTAKKQTKKATTSRLKQTGATKKMNDNTDQSVAQDQSPIADALAVDQSLETVREILFGRQAKEHDQRAKDIEKALADSVRSLGKELDRQVSRIEKNIDKLTDQLVKQAAQTAQEVSQQFDETNTTISKLETATKAAQVDLHEDLTADRLELENKTQAWNDSLAAQLESVRQNLQHAKTDRSSLSELLHGMADSIAAEPLTKAKKK